MLEQGNLYKELERKAQQVKSINKAKELSTEELVNIGFLEMMECMDLYIDTEHGELKPWLMKQAARAMNTEINREKRHRSRTVSLGTSILPTNPHFLDEADESMSWSPDWTTSIVENLVDTASECSWTVQAFSDRLDMITILRLLEDLDRGGDMIDILWLDSQGVTDAQIADQMGMPLGSVDWLRKSALAKLHKYLETDQKALLDDFY